MRPLAFLVFSQFIYLSIYLFIYSQIKKLEFTKTNHRLWKTKAIVKNNV